MTVDPDDLATYLNDPSIDQDRAQHFIDRTVTLCQSVVTPLPDAADVVVERVAGRAYASAVRGGGKQAMAGGSPFAAVPGAGAVYLTQYDIADLRRLNGGGGAFSIDLLPVGYVAPFMPIGEESFGDWDTPT